jgi:hypothetical protein
VNESRVSQLHARALRRLRDALAKSMPREQAAAALRSTVLQFLQKPAPGEGAPALRTDARGRPALPEQVAHGPQQLAQPERLGQPGAAALLEEALGIGAGDVAGHEDEALAAGEPLAAIAR